ncbi:PEPxxWA-CTERM sorting domain-containing protein [Sphingobium sp. H39-3-25]|uniref:PEPxxWA-CTERM sorting domain-containing protein n=1 Tax=Sphingobium arseniciresistens TaxID=3030834 RepID=UPI0023B8F61A|nr:PEPxxWA-CTERM sorting domain-containing protein [Sphingobium arseniciresistens]
MKFFIGLLVLAATSATAISASVTTVVLDGSPTKYRAPDGSYNEPATWAILVIGFGLVGSSMRHRPRPRVSFA